MEISTWISNNETLLNGLAAVIVIFGFLGAIGRTLFKGLRDESRKASHSNKITLAELSSPSPYRIEFANSEGVNIAYSRVGDSGPPLIVTPGIISNLHVTSHLPPIRETMNSLAEFAKIINFDKRGQGLSDPTSQVATMEERVKDISCIADTTQTEKFFLMGCVYLRATQIS